jgi:hypothetical protein
MNEKFLPCSYGCDDSECEMCVPYVGPTPSTCNRPEVIAWLRRAVAAMEHQWRSRRS